MNNTRLTIQYCLHQLAYWAAAAGVMSFATTFLLAKGFPASQVGTVMAAGSLLSCFTQPFLAAKADRSGKRTLFGMVMGLTALSALCFAALLLRGLPPLLFALLYLAGVWSFDAMMPLLNSVCVHFQAMGCAINYGVARAVGSASFAAAALGIGYLIDKAGVNSMILLCLLLLLLCLLVTAGYPRGGDASSHTVVSKNESCGVAEFFRRYRWYCLSLLGILLLAMFHAMTENYLIAIFQRLGGGSDNVGVALFVATAAEAGVLIFFTQIRQKLGNSLLLKLGGVSFLIKAVLFLFADSIAFVYLCQVLQMTSYAFISPVQLYYADDKVSRTDMVKGQAFITASYTLGCALGNFAGGVLVEHLGVTAMLFAGVGMAAAGTLVLVLTVDKTDRYTLQTTE
ncbi:MAG: MFS transporter [Ruminococcaceae bacterium]|nr:MFS transporter [Oscillospiraceae bacterium]